MLWGVIVFFLLSAATLPPSAQVSLSKSVEFSIFLLSIVWLVSSLLVKVGLILEKRWLKVSIISCLSFILLMVNMGLIRTSFSPETSGTLDPSLSRLFNLVAIWFTSWFCIDLLVILLSWTARIINKWKIQM